MIRLPAPVAIIRDAHMFARFPPWAVFLLNSLIAVGAGFTISALL